MFYPLDIKLYRTDTDNLRLFWFLWYAPPPFNIKTMTARVRVRGVSDKNTVSYKAILAYAPTLSSVRRRKKGELFFLLEQIWAILRLGEIVCWVKRRITHGRKLLCIHVRPIRHCHVHVKEEKYKITFLKGWLLNHSLIY